MAPADSVAGAATASAALSARRGSGGYSAPGEAQRWRGLGGWRDLGGGGARPRRRGLARGGLSAGVGPQRRRVRRVAALGARRVAGSARGGLSAGVGAQRRRDRRVAALGARRVAGSARGGLSAGVGAQRRRVRRVAALGGGRAQRR